jgi:hypothetical protein
MQKAEHPKQQYDGNWNSNQPEQNAFSHTVLLSIQKDHQWERTAGQLALGTSRAPKPHRTPSVEIRRRWGADSASRVIRPQLKFAVRHQLGARPHRKAANRGADNYVPSCPR